MMPKANWTIFISLEEVPRFIHMWLLFICDVGLFYFLRQGIAISAGWPWVHASVTGMCHHTQLYHMFLCSLFLPASSFGKL
jgi:hypothetical protein